MKRTLEQIKTDALAGFALHGAKLGLLGQFIGTKVTVEGVEYTILGLNRRIRLNPIVTLNEATGKVRNFPLTQYASSTQN